MISTKESVVIAKAYLYQKGVKYKDEFELYLDPACDHVSFMYFTETKRLRAEQRLKEYKAKRYLYEL